MKLKFTQTLVVVWDLYLLFKTTNLNFDLRTYKGLLLSINLEKRVLLNISMFKRRRTVWSLWTCLTLKTTKSWDTLIVKFILPCYLEFAAQLFPSLTTIKPLRILFKVPCLNRLWAWIVPTLKSEWKLWFIWCITHKDLLSSQNLQNTSPSNNCPSDAIQLLPWPVLLVIIRKTVSLSIKALLKEECSEVFSTELTNLKKISLQPIHRWLKFVSQIQKNVKFMTKLFTNSILMESFHQDKPLRMKKFWSAKFSSLLIPIEIPLKPEENTKILH